MIADLLQKKYPGFRLISSHVGSMGGLTALKRGEAHLAGVHLLDEETGEYNLSYVKRVLNGRKMVLVNLSYRIQGMLVAPGNPKGFRKLKDLEIHLRFINDSGSPVHVCWITAQRGFLPQ